MDTKYVYHLICQLRLAVKYATNVRQISLVCLAAWNIGSIIALGRYLLDCLDYEF